MPRLLQQAALFLILATPLPTIPMLMAEEPPAPPQAPRPGQIIAAKKVFISNGGEDRWLVFDPKHNPTLTYNTFYADMKNWGKYELVSSPADADVVFEIHLAVRQDGYSQLRLLILDPKTRITLWALNQVIQSANRDATAHKNFDTAMNVLVESVKKLTGSP